MPATPPPLPPPPPSEPAGAAPDPEPRPFASPLNRDEERSLADLEGELRRSDPDLESEMSSLARDERFSLDRVLQAVAIAVIVLVLVPTDWLAGILSFGLLLGIPFAMAMIAARAKREGGTGEGGEQRHDGDDRRS